MVNKVILVGNLTKDAEALASSGKAMTRMRLATNSHWRDAAGESKTSSEFHNVISFGRLAETCASYCTKGRRIYIEGRLRTRDYEAADGNKRYTTEVVADTVKLLAPKEAEAGQAGQVDDDSVGGSALEPLAAAS